MVKQAGTEIIDVRSVLRKDCAEAFDAQRLRTRLLAHFRPVAIGLADVAKVERRNLRSPALAAYLFAIEGLSRVTELDGETTRSVVASWTRLSYQAEKLLGLSRRGRKAKKSVTQVRNELLRIDRRSPSDGPQPNRAALQSAFEKPREDRPGCGRSGFSSGRNRLLSALPRRALPVIGGAWPNGIAL